MHMIDFKGCVSHVSGKTYSLKKTKDLKSLGIGENELEELDWGKTSNLCVARKTDGKR